MLNTDRKFRFRDFQVYKDARIFVREVKELTKLKFPSSERFGLIAQLWRALDSIILNIAEGADRGSDKDFGHFLNIAHTSLNEVVACLDIAFDSHYLSQQEQDIYIGKAAMLANQITAFRKKVLG